MNNAINQVKRWSSTANRKLKVFLGRQRWDEDIVLVNITTHIAKVTTHRTTINTDISIDDHAGYKYGDGNEEIVANFTIDRQQNNLRGHRQARALSSVDFPAPLDTKWKLD